MALLPEKRFSGFFCPQGEALRTNEAQKKHKNGKQNKRNIKQDKYVRRKYKLKKSTRGKVGAKIELHYF